MKINLIDVQHEKDISEGAWDSSHLCTVKFVDNIVHYTLISTIILQMVFNHVSCGNVNLSGNITKKVNYNKFILN